MSFCDLPLAGFLYRNNNVLYGVKILIDTSKKYSEDQMKMKLTKKCFLCETFF